MYGCPEHITSDVVAAKRKVVHTIKIQSNNLYRKWCGVFFSLKAIIVFFFSQLILNEKHPTLFVRNSVEIETKVHSLN